MVFNGHAGVGGDGGVVKHAVHALQGVYPGVYFGAVGAVAGYGLEGVENDVADVVGQDILLEALFGGGVDYHRGSLLVFFMLWNPLLTL